MKYKKRIAKLYGELVRKVGKCVAELQHIPEVFYYESDAEVLSCAIDEVDKIVEILNTLHKDLEDLYN